MTKKIIIGLSVFLLTISCATNQQEKEVSFKGSFQSLKGVMNKLSCYGYNVGYLTTAEGKEIPVCFQNDNDAESCKTISIKGYFRNVKNNPEKTNPCPTGEMSIFFVNSYNCQ